MSFLSSLFPSYSQRQIKKISVIADKIDALADRYSAMSDAELKSQTDVFRTRLQEFRKKTVPVLQHYRALGLLIEVKGDQSRDAVFNEIVSKLYAKASQSLS